MREGGFPDPDEALDEGGSRKATAVRIRPAPDLVFTAPALAARQTTDVLGHVAAVEPALADMDWGAWRGRRLVDLVETDSEAVMAWIKAPAFGTPSGESFVDILDRVSVWMEDRAASEARILAVTHPNILRAALAHALGVTPEAAFRIDVPPLTTLVLSFNGVWRFQGLSVDGTDA